MSPTHPKSPSAVRKRRPQDESSSILSGKHGGWPTPAPSAAHSEANGGVSSAYSYNPLTAKPNQQKHTLATQCAILNDLILRYIVGFTPRADHLLEFNPIALDSSVGHLRWGPFLYKHKYSVMVEWTGAEYVVTVNGSSLRFPKPTHVVAEFDSNGRLVRAGVDPLAPERQ